MPKINSRILTAFLILILCNGVTFRSYAGPLKTFSATPVREEHGKILFTAGQRLVLVDRATRNTIWESSGLRGALCVAAMPNGQFLVGEGKTVARIDAEGRFLSRTSPIFTMTTDVKPLANERFLVSDGPGKLVAEMDWTGNITWSVKGLHFPSEAIRLENGNTLVADGTAALKEFDVSGNVVHTTVFKRWVASVARLADGNILAGQSSALDLVNPEGHSIWSLSLASRVTGVQEISSTEFLICEPDIGRVAIIDSNGLVLWELSGLRYPWRAIYLQ